MNGTTAKFAAYVRRSFRSKWRLLGMFATRDEANDAAFKAPQQHTWVTELLQPNTTQTEDRADVDAVRQVQGRGDP